MRKRAILFFYLFASLPLFSQNYGEEIKQMLTAFAALESYSITAKVFVTGEEDYSFSSFIKSSPEGVHVKADIAEMLLNKKYAVSIDHEEKLIRVDKGDFLTEKRGKENIGLELLGQVNIDNAITEYLGQTDQYKTYVIHHEGAIVKTLVKIDTRTNFFYEIEVFYESEEISISSYKVRYTSFKKNVAFSKQDFDQKTVFTVDRKGNLTPTSRYSGYQLIKQYETSNN